MSDLADIIAQETGDGRLVVRFLISAMDGDLPDFQPCHRIDAARLLVKLGFDQAQTVIDRTHAAQRATNRESRSQPQAQRQSDSQSADNSIRSQLAAIVREETDDGRIAVRFLIDVMQGELPDFKPCHRLSAARELLQRGFDYVPDDAEAQADEPAELTPEELEAQRRRAEDMEFALHGPVYYKTHPFPCACEDRLHDCKGNLLDDQQRAKAVRKSPGWQFFIGDPDSIKDYVARYADYLDRHNAENPHNPIDINRLHWLDPRWQHLNPVNSVRPIPSTPQPHPRPLAPIRQHRTLTPGAQV